MEHATGFRAGREVGSRPLVNMLLVLGFDVYRQSPETTANVAKQEGYDLTKFHEDIWEGQPVQRSRTFALKITTG
jgi:hypothetical protein